MSEPYEAGRRARMTDGVHEAGRMLGDVKFHAHGGRVEAGVGERWRGSAEWRGARLGEVTRSLMEELGYDPDEMRGDTGTAGAVAATGAGTRADEKRAADTRETGAGASVTDATVADKTSAGEAVTSVAGEAARGGGAALSPITPIAREADTEESLTNVEQLSDEELDAMLKNLLTGGA
jgi:hypothetical protein